MVNLDFSVTSWGSPTAPKRALLLHGTGGTGAVFFKRVDAPDLLGHGWAPHSSETYTIPLLASYFAKHISGERYDVIAGVSIGAATILPLLTQLKYPPARAVLVEPTLDMPPPSDEKIAEAVKAVLEPASEEELLAKNPRWIREEAILKRLALVQIDPKLVSDLLKERQQGGSSHTLVPSPSSLPNTELIILAADPTLRSVYPASHATMLERDYPHVKFGVKAGITHDAHKTGPEVVASVIMDGMQGQMGIVVLRV